MGITASSTDVNGPAVTYSLTDDAGGRFAIDATTGVVTVANGTLLDFETATSHQHHGPGDRRCRWHQHRRPSRSASPTPTRGSPVDTDPAANSVAEGAAAGTAVGVTAASADPGGGTRHLVPDR